MDLWDPTIAVAMVEAYKALALVEQVEHVIVAFRPPPLAQLAVPIARKLVEEFRMLQGCQRIEILIAQMPFKRILGGQCGQGRVG